MNKTLIIGAGISGLGAARLLRSLRRPVLVSDVSVKYPDSVRELERGGFDVLIGQQDESLLQGVGELIVSPGLSPKVPILEASRRLGIPIRSEIDLALAHYKGQVAGITGTNGKSTTTTLIAHTLRGLGFSAEASGNIGIPPSQILAEGRTPDPLVLELSSYQLDFSNPIKNRAAVFTSFSEDHLERHQTMENYFMAKWKLMMATERHGLCIMPRSIVEKAREYGAPRPKADLVEIVIDDEKPLAWSRGPWVRLDTKRQVLTGEGIKGERPLPPEFSFHNQLNIIMTALAVQAFQKTPWEDCLRQVRTYTWLDFRFQKIGTYQGFPVYNDSKSTNVESTLMALKSLREPAYLLLGGHPKGESFAPILEFAPRIHRVIAFGAASPRISAELSSINPISFPTLEGALDHFPDLLAKHPAPVAFSPACSSFDEFKNFEDRGRYFTRRMQSYLDA